MYSFHQPYVPSVEGYHTFRSEINAKKLAEYVISKINKGILPPAVTVREVDSLGVIPGQ